MTRSRSFSSNAFAGPLRMDVSVVYRRRGGGRRFREGPSLARVQPAAGVHRVESPRMVLSYSITAQPDN